MADYVGIRMSPPPSRKEPEREPSTSEQGVEGATYETPTKIPADHADTPRRRFIVATKDFSGFGWAKRLDEEGEDVILATAIDEDDPEMTRQTEMIGRGWIETVKLSKAVNTLQSDNTYWIWDGNHNPEVAQKLIDAGQKVFPAGITLGEKMEHDRHYATQIAEEYGLDPPPTHEFNSLKEGIAFLDAHADKAYVFKVDDNKYNYMTFVPFRREDADANRELYTYLSHMKQEPGTFILQERIAQEDALEVNVEAWFYEGQPFLASVGLEVKRKNTYDVGEMTGCAGDFVQFIPLDCPLVQQTIGLLFPFYEQERYTGFADVNVIFTKDGIPHFLEVCNRFGYNAHPTMFLGLGKDTFGNIMADYIDGKVEDIPERFHKDIGGSLTLFLDHQREGLPIHIDPDETHRVYLYDGYKEEDETLLTGFNTAEGGLLDNAGPVAMVLDHGESIEAVAHKIAEDVALEEIVSFPDMYYRWDLWEDNFYNAPLVRYKELKKRGLL